MTLIFSNNPMNNIYKLRKLGSALLSTLLIISCQPSPDITPSPDKNVISENDTPQVIVEITTEDVLIAKNLLEAQDWDKAIEMYRYLANNSKQPKASEYYQTIAFMLYSANRFTELEPFYSSLDEDALQPAEQIGRDVLLSAVYFENGKTYQSLVNLPDLETITLPAYKAIALNIRSKGVLAIGKPLESARLRIQISQFLHTELQIEQNQAFIWDALNHISENRIIRALSEQQIIELRGWLELNLIARRSDMLPEKIEPWINQWHSLYPEHEAATGFSETLLAESRLIHIDPAHIVLFLPLNNKLKNVSEAIQNGFLYAYYNDPGNKPVLDIIDTSQDSQDFISLYHQAIQEGADFIVGPLDKKHVNDLLLKSKLQIPTLTLNYAENDQAGASNLYQFGLRPEDEAEQIAEHALSNNQYHAVTLIPDTPLGYRVQKAFTQKFESLGGRVISSNKYPPKKNDYSISIKQLLNLNASNRRHSILQTVIGENTSFKPRRRQDIDMIFIVGNPRQARLIKPQLDFHHASKLPVYATSTISSSKEDKDANRDLNDIMYVETPWAINNSSNPDYQAINKLWPKQSQRYAKFFALGVDAYNLIPSLRRLKINPEKSEPYNTGAISVDQNGRIHRELLLATYKNGRATIFEEETD